MKNVLKKPNILFLFTDDQGFDTINALGNSEIITPNMDKLVFDGTSFMQAHIPGGTSAAVCMPSRAMLHTGRSLFHIEKEGQQISPNHTTIGEAFGSAGYRTFGTGKWHNGVESYARSFTYGDSIFFWGMWDHWNVPLCNYDPTGKYDNLINCTREFMYDNKTMKLHCDRFSTGKHSTCVISEAAIEFIEKYDYKEPFFMYVSFLAPHDPRSMPEEFLNMYDPDKISIPENYLEKHPFEFGVEKIRDELLAPYPRTKSSVRRHIAEYYAMITHLDHEIGRILKVLHDSEKTDNTIIVLAGDNGLALGRHGLMGKQNNYEHSIRVPLVFKGPGVPPGLKIQNYAYILDVYPTLCELAGIPVPGSVEGLSLLPMMADPSVKVHDTLYFAYNDLVRSVKNERYKLIEYAGQARETQLFDMACDVFEMNNLYGHRKFDDTVSKLRYELIKLKDSWDDEQHPLGRAFWEAYK